MTQSQQLPRKDDDNVDNVRAVVSDLTAASEGSDGTITGVTPNIISSMDYAPYGSLLTARSIDPSRYRYAFNGKEQDDEVKGGSGRHYDLGARHYDPRIGRMLSIDPRTNEYPWQSPYAYHANQPHFSIDFNGEGDNYGAEITLFSTGTTAGAEAATRQRRWRPNASSSYCLLRFCRCCCTFWLVSGSSRSLFFFFSAPFSRASRVLSPLFLDGLRPWAPKNYPWVQFFGAHGRSHALPMRFP